MLILSNSILFGLVCNVVKCPEGSHATLHLCRLRRVWCWRPPFPTFGPWMFKFRRLHHVASVAQVSAVASARCARDSLIPTFKSSELQHAYHASTMSFFIVLGPLRFAVRKGSAVPSSK